MLKTRLITAGIAAFIIIYIFSFAPQAWFYFLFVSVVFLAIFMSATEFIGIRWNIMDGPNYVELSRPKLQIKHYAIGFAYAFPLIIYAYCKSSSNLYLGQNVYLILSAWVFLSLLVVIMCIYKSSENIQTASHKLINVMAGFIYIFLPGLFALKMVELVGPVRSCYVYFAIATINMGDAGGYFIGTKFGKHKLVPKISPKKSVEGSLGGLLFSVCTAVFVRTIFNLPFGIIFCIIAGLLLGLAGQLGDLMESAFKRAGGFKDSGHLFPGHGGFLDRMDSLVLGIPIAYILISFVL